MSEKQDGYKANRDYEVSEQKISDLKILIHEMKRMQSETFNFNL